MKITYRQAMALEGYAEMRGRTWKADLLQAWASGKTEGVLQELRNAANFGPRGLKAYKRLTREQHAAMSQEEQHGTGAA